MRRNKTKTFSPLLILGMLGCLAFLLLYWKRLLLMGTIPFDGNTLRLHIPSWIIGKNLLLDHGALLWDPYRNMGQPFLADPQNQTLYPFRLFSLFLNFLDYQRIYICGHALLASTAGYVLGEKITKDRFAAVLTGLLIGFNGFLFSRITVSTHFAVLCWVPVVWALAVFRRPIWLGAALTFQWMAGYPPIFALSYGSMIVFLLFLDDRKSTLFNLGKATLLFLGLSAIQILPFLTHLSSSMRPLTLSFDAITEFSVHPLESIRYLFLPAPVLNRLPPLTNADSSMVTFFFGFASIFLFVWALTKRNRAAAGCAVLSIIGILFSHGKFLPLYEHLPIAAFFRHPGHWLTITFVPFALVCAFGFRNIPNKAVRIGIFLIIAADLLIFAWPAKTFWGEPSYLLSLPHPPSLYTPGSDSTRIYHHPSITQRAHRWRVTDPEHWETLRSIGLPSIPGSFLQREMESYTVLTGKRQNIFLSRLAREAPDSVLFDYANVSRQVFLPGTGVFPSVPMLGYFQYAKNPNPSGRAFFLNGEPVSADVDVPGEFSAMAKGPGRLVFSEAFFPGWTVTVDGIEKKPEPFEDAFLSVTLPEGERRVRFLYSPPSFWWGLGVTGLTILILLGIRLKRFFHPLHRIHRKSVHV